MTSDSGREGGAGAREKDGISFSTIRRLSRYYRVLEAAAEEDDLTHISSRELAERNGVTSAQVRKDLSSFGTFGKRGLGYPVRELRDAILRILGMDHQWPNPATPSCEPMECPPRPAIA